MQRRFLISIMIVGSIIKKKNHLCISFPPPPNAGQEKGGNKIVCEKVNMSCGGENNPSLEWELCTPLCNTSAAATSIAHQPNTIHSNCTSHLEFRLFWSEMVLQRSEQVWQPWNHAEAKQRQNQRHPEGLRLPGSSVWPEDLRSWNTQQPKVRLSSRSPPTPGDLILRPSGSHLKRYGQGEGREAAAPSPPPRPAPARSWTLQPLPRMTPLPLEHPRGGL